MILLASHTGCSGGTEGSEFDQQQVLLGTIWCEPQDMLLDKTWTCLLNYLQTFEMLFYLFAGEDVVFIANDWHTALLPCYLKSMYQSQGIYRNAKVGFPSFLKNLN